MQPLGLGVSGGPAAAAVRPLRVYNRSVYDHTAPRPPLNYDGGIAPEHVQRQGAGVGHRKNSILVVIQRDEPAADAWRTETPDRKRKRRRVVPLQNDADSDYFTRSTG
jgi:hypothetical protein